MVLNICCTICSATIGHLYIPFFRLLNEKKNKGGNMQDNKDICIKLGIARTCCRTKIICALPDRHFHHIAEKLIGKKSI